MTAFQTTRDALRSTLSDAVTILKTLSDEDFASGEDRIGLSSIGAHLRHVGDACERFLDGVVTGRIDYDRRERDVRYEIDRAFAIERIEDLVVRIGRLSPVAAGLTLEVNHDAPGGVEDLRMRSSIERELMFLASHSVHHFALVAVLLRAKQIDIAPEFGVAVSTLRHRAEGASCAP